MAILVFMSPFGLSSVSQAAPVTTPTTSMVMSTEALLTATTTPAAGVAVTPLSLGSGVLSGTATATAISCTAPGDCVAGVEVLMANAERDAMIPENHGTWGKARFVGAVSKSGTAFISWVMCPRAGACVALGQQSSGGSATTNARYSSFFVVQRGTRWAKSQPLPTTGLGAHPNYLTTAMACFKVGSCVVTGTLLFDSSRHRVFSLTWRHGHWGRPFFLDSSALGTTAQLLSLGALSCRGSWCEGVGLFKSSENTTRPYVVTYSGGRWHEMHPLEPYRARTNVNLLDTISCTGVGTCVAGGQSDSLKGPGGTALAVEEIHGRWSAPYALTTTGANVLESVSCTTTTTPCTGVITHVGGVFAGMVTLSASRHWNLTSTASAPGWYSLWGWAMSCVSGQCTLVGSGTTSSGGPLLPIVIIPRAK